MKKTISLLLFISLMGCTLHTWADTTTINQKGMPVPSAMAPSMSAFSQDVCAVPISGAGNFGVVSIAGGTVILDQNCVKIKLAKTLNDLGLKVAAVSVLCQDPTVFEAMTNSGSPCPIMGMVGNAALKEHYKQKPDYFRKLYGEEYYNKLVVPVLEEKK
jgi:hypothetical protein